MAQSHDINAAPLCPQGHPAGTFGHGRCPEGSLKTQSVDPAKDRVGLVGNLEPHAPFDGVPRRRARRGDSWLPGDDKTRLKYEVTQDTDSGLLAASERHVSFFQRCNLARAIVPVAISRSWFATHAAANASVAKPVQLTRGAVGKVTSTTKLASICRAILYVAPK